MIRRVTKAVFVALIVLSFLTAPFATPDQSVNLLGAVHQNVHRNVIDPPMNASIAPSKVWGTLFGTSGDVEIDLNRTGIAVRVEIPREFLEGVIYTENDTHFIESNIRNDYYYYNVVDESNHWTYAATRIEKNNEASDGPCFKPRFSLRDPNAPWCVEIWNYLNGTFLNFTPPKFIRFHNLHAPSVAGTYNFTVSVATKTNFIGYPDFANATGTTWSTTLFVPVSMQDDPASISGTICDAWFTSPSCVPIVGTKGIAYAEDSSGTIDARSYVNETNGQFNITGLAPGTYQVLASAGFNRAYDTAYSLSPSASPVTVVKGGHTIIQLLLNRAPQVCGSISYRGGNNAPLTHALSDNPSLQETGLKVLNITVETLDSAGHMYRNASIVTNNATDNFRLLMGSNVSYVGTDPYGTEFAGLEPTTAGSYQLTLNFWISGYVQASTATVTVDTYQVPGGDSVCNYVSPSPVLMRAGAAIHGYIQFWNYVGLETPQKAERSLPIKPPFKATGALFGGNILIQAYDSAGILRAVSVINGTAADGTTLYKTKSRVSFWLFGFNEYLNRTWSGTWNEQDSGLAVSTYTIQVYIRGYEQERTRSIQIGTPGGIQDVTVKMLRGGAFEVGVFSYDNRFGTRAPQAPILFPFLNLSIPVRGRTYFYDSSGRDVGYVECVLRLGVPQPDPLCVLGTAVPGSAGDSFTVIFAGQNWSLQEIWFFGDIPTHLTNDNYTIETFILGYVWPHGPVLSPNSLVGFYQIFVTLFIGNEIDITGPIFINAQLLGQLPENDHVIGQVFGAGLAGAAPANVTAGTKTLSMRILGFGGMAESNGTLEGQGHFFYVDPSGYLYFDYGLDNKTSYVALVPEFGFNQHFMEPVPSPSITFNDLFLQAGVVMKDIAMATVSSSLSYVTGWASSDDSIVILSWVQVTAVNATYTRTATTLDGQYVGPGALFLPQGTYNITFSVAFFKSQTLVNLAVQWGGSYVALPPAGALCPTAGIPGICDPPAASPPSATSVPASLPNTITTYICIDCPETPIRKVSGVLL